MVGWESRPWWLSVVPPEPGRLYRLSRALLRLFARPALRGGYGSHGGGDNPTEGAGVPARPKRPAPTLLAAAEVELPSD
jgi:hypothetical protein